MEAIAALTTQGPWVFIAIITTAACAALWRQNDRLNSSIKDYGQQSAREYRETLTKMLEHTAATQLALQVNAQTIAALERTISNMERSR